MSTTIEEPSQFHVKEVSELPRDLAVVKMENDSIMAQAAARPRDYEDIKTQLMQQLVAYPSFARSAIYAKPVGRENGEMKYARGLSIRAAEAIAETYGYNSIRVNVMPVDDTHVKIEASFTDYQRGSVRSFSSIVSKLYRDRRGKTRRHSDDRFFTVVVKAESSKLLREVILRSVPPGLRSELEESVDQAVTALLDEKTVGQMLAKFSEKGATKEMIERHMGKTVDKMTVEDRSLLLGVWNAIEAGETTIAEAFEAATNGTGNGGDDGSKSRTETLASNLNKTSGRETTEKDN